MGPAASAIAARCAPGVAEPSGPVMALPPRAITTRREGSTPATLAGTSLAVKYQPGSVASAAPEVEPVLPGAEARSLDDVDGEIELVAHPTGLVRVAAEADRLAPLLVEPAHLVGRGQRAAGVDLERPARGGEGTEDGPVLLLEVLLHVPVRAPGPVAAREVAVREHLEDVAA